MVSIYADRAARRTMCLTVRVIDKQHCVCTRRYRQHYERNARTAVGARSEGVGCAGAVKRGETDRLLVGESARV